MIIDVGMGINPLTTVVAKEIQIAEFAELSNDWHNHFTELWTQKNKIDSETVK